MSDPTLSSVSRASVIARFALLAAWCVAVWMLSSSSDPEPDAEWWISLPDWAYHGIEFAAGGFLARNAFSAVLRRRVLLAALSFCLAWALLDEWHQSFVPQRHPSVLDLIWDLSGSLLGCLAHGLLARCLFARDRGRP